MITLKHLTVERFRLLREINLHFPQRGSILIEGPNEAGKTALLESIYFALYGEALTPLVSNHHKRTLDDLVLYGASQAKVSLTLSIGASELSITRSIERQAGSAGGAEQQVSVEVSRAGRPGMPAGEPITHLTAANECILTDRDLCHRERHCRIGKIVTGATQINFLSYRRSRTDFDFA